MSSMLSFALAYARRLGWKVFPLEVRGKKPLTLHGYKDATTDEARIRAWWGETPEANIGLACGLSDVAVVDLDGPEAIERWNLIVESMGMPFVQAAVQVTGKGNHLVYRQPDGVRVKNTVGQIGEKIDTRGDGGYIVLAPSVHPSGARYEWIEGAHPTNGYDTFPSCMLEYLKEKELPEPTEFAPTKRWAGAMQKAYERVVNAPERTRNDTLYKATFYLAHVETEDGGRLSLSEVRELMQHAGLANGLGRREVEATIESAIRGKR